MNYLVPAWQSKLGNWASDRQNNFDDAVSLYHLLDEGKDSVGLLITDYQPDLMTKLTYNNLPVEHIFSVFDFLQGIDRVEPVAFSLDDFSWPKDSYIQYTVFGAIVRDFANEVIAQVTYAFDGQIIEIQYFENNVVSKTLRIDGRGFVSSISYPDHIDYLNLAGQVTLRVEQDGRAIYQGNKYQSLADLVQKVVQEQFLAKLTEHDHLIVSVNDHSLVDQLIFSKFHPIFQVSQWHESQQSLPKLATIDGAKFVFDTNHAQQVSPVNGPVIPLYHAEINLGISQRFARKKIYLLIDDLDRETCLSLVRAALTQVLKDPDTHELILLADQAKQEFCEQLISQVQRENDGFFELLSANQLVAENQALELAEDLDQQDLPQVSLHAELVSSNDQLLSLLSDARILIDFRPVPDPFIQMAAVSLGVPMIQRVETNEVHDQVNGKICQTPAELTAALAFYLDSLTNWNDVLARDVKIMDDQSLEKLRARFKQLMEESHD